MNTEKPSPDAREVQKNIKSSEKENEKKEQPEKALPEEKGGFEKRPEPTRFGDWEVNGRCSDF